MNDIRPIIGTETGRRPRVAIFMSGSGSNAEQILRRVRGDGQAPLEVAVLVTDAPETSRARELGAAYGVPVVENDIRRFYHDRGEARLSVATPTGRQIREAWTDALRAQLQPYGIDFGVFAGFVPLTNLTDRLPCLNVHPGDLTYLRDGRRHLVGLHTVPIERAILEGLKSLRSSVIQAVPYTGQGDDMDSGPILGISPPVAIDLSGVKLSELRACVEARPERRPKGGYGDRLEELAVQSQERLKREGDWVVLPEVTYDVARGRFGTDATGQLHYRLKARWHPIQTVVYDGLEREVLFAGSLEE